MQGSTRRRTYPLGVCKVEGLALWRANGLHHLRSGAACVSAGAPAGSMLCLVPSVSRVPSQQTPCRAPAKHLLWGTPAVHATAACSSACGRCTDAAGEPLRRIVRKGLQISHGLAPSCVNSCGATHIGFWKIFGDTQRRQLRPPLVMKIVRRKAGAHRPRTRKRPSPLETILG